MNPGLNFTPEQAETVANDILISNRGKAMSRCEELVLQASLRGKTYEQMATEGYSVGHLRQVGACLWHDLSEALGEEVTKTNFQQALKRASYRFGNIITPLELEFPQGPVPLTSSFYVERGNIETVCKEEIVRPGALIRIKAPKQMGKTSLLDRILQHAGNQEYKTVRLNLREADAGKFGNLDSFLRWFSAYIPLQLKLPNQIDDYWYEEMIGSKSSCKNYFDSYLLQQIETPLVVALDEVDRIFDFPHISQEFFPMLRSWHEEAKTVDIWKQLRLIVVHSTEDYGRLDINQSPFNVGSPVELKEFSEAEVQNLAHRHNLEWKNEPVQQLMKMVGGHPYLIRLALYHLASRHLKLEEFLKDAATDAGIYNEHLRRHLETLQQHPKLAAALKQVVNSPEPVKIDTMLGYKLDSMGLINRHGDYSSPKCHLYRLYFAPRLKD